MDGAIWLLVWTTALGLIAGYRYERGGTSSGLVLVLGFAFAQPKQALRCKEIDPVRHEPGFVDHARPSVHEGEIYHLCSRECREICEAAPALYIYAGVARDPSRPRAALAARDARD